MACLMKAGDDSLGFGRAMARVDAYGTSSLQRVMDCDALARDALLARVALIDLAATASKMPKLRLNLMRSIELLEELAIRAKGGEAKLETFAGGGMISTALPGGLKVPAGVLPELKIQVTPEALVAHEIAVRSDMAKRTGAKGGAKRSVPQVAAFEKMKAARDEKLAALKASRMAEQAPPSPTAQ